jgi:hypothetical protein
MEYFIQTDFGHIRKINQEKAAIFTMVNMLLIVWPATEILPSDVI